MVNFYQNVIAVCFLDSNSQLTMFGIDHGLVPNRWHAITEPMMIKLHDPIWCCKPKWVKVVAAELCWCELKCDFFIRWDAKTIAISTHRGRYNITTWPNVLNPLNVDSFFLVARMRSVGPGAGMKGTGNYIPQIMWDVITCTCPSNLLLAQRLYLSDTVGCNYLIPAFGITHLIFEPGT